MGRWIGAVGAAWVLVQGQALAGECRMTVVSHLPLERGRDGLMVQALLSGKPAELIFDTGSFTSILTFAAVDRVGLRRLTGEEFSQTMGLVGGIGGSRNSMAVTAKTVELGGLVGRNYNFVAADVVSPPADGLLSTDLISQYDVDLDFPQDQAVLYQPVGDCSAPAAFLDGPLSAVPLRPIGTDRRPRVNVTINGQNVVALIDTGAGRSAIFRRAAERLGLRMDEGAGAPHGTASGVGPREVAVIPSVFEAVTIGDMTINNMQVQVLDDRGQDEVEMLLGADFQRKVHVWISYSSHNLIMQYPPRASKQPLP